MTNAIQKLNDAFRKTFSGGRIMLTLGINTKPSNEIAEIIRKVKQFNNFTTANDPYEEHDMGRFDYKGQKIMFKIDYYDKSLCYLSNDPADPEQTVRVMTIMTAAEY
ncbi:MAG: DUF3768 domain-containing protein [Alphaproteobacteria bacterium]|nr:DUF3768 domain-containing protein [Alphaproteobacteria bacterium]